MFLGLLIVSVPFSLASGQEKKTENKIRIVIDDGSGSETVFDTTITSGETPKTITLKNGKVIFLGETGTNVFTDDENKHIYVSVTTDSDDAKKIEKKIVIRDGKGDKMDGDAKFDVYVESDEESESDATQYVIARDGLVVTIKGNDETKVKDLAREIENKLKIKSENDAEKQPEKAKPEKSVKK